jgi:poly(3-hydroxybutyrate) depolymerase
VPSAGAEEVLLTDGDSVHGSVFRQGDRLRVNPYRSRVAAMTYGVIDLPLSQVAKVEPDATRDAWYARLDALAPGDVEGREALLALAKTLRLRPERLRAAQEILRVDPAHADALRAAGGTTKWEAARRGHLQLDPAVRPVLRRLLRLESAHERRDEAARLHAERGFDASAAVVERMARSLHEPRGVRHEVPLHLLARDGAAPTYSLYVPSDYDAIEPRPLVVGLHGGGIANARGEAVVGTGRDAFELFVQGAKERGWFLACPTAVEAPWPVSANEALLDALLVELGARFNIDLDRVFLVGQGGGAAGALWYAARNARDLTAVGVAGVPSLAPASSLVGRDVGLWIYQGESDEIVPLDGTRKAVAALARRGADFVYCELPGAGHSPPAAAEADLYAYFAPKRCAGAKSAWPRSSFRAPPADREIEVHGDPAAGWQDDLDADVETLERVLRAGRYDAELAARALARLGPERAGPVATFVLGKRDLPLRARLWAAWLCGQVGGEACVAALADAVRVDTDLRLRSRAARGLRLLRDDLAVEDLRWALSDLAQIYARPGDDPDAVPFQVFEGVCAAMADVVEAIGATAGDAGIGADIEAAAVLGVLRDRRRIVASAVAGEDPEVPRARLARACGRAYRALGAEQTLVDMLRSVVKRHPGALQAAGRGYAEGLPR